MKTITVNIDEDDNLALLRDHYRISPEILGYAHDPHEGAHMEYDPDDHTLLIVYSISSGSGANAGAKPTPITFFVQNNELITITRNETDYVRGVIMELLDHYPDGDAHELMFVLFDVLTSLTKKCFPMYSAANQRRENLTTSLNRRVTRHGLFAMSELGVHLVFLETSAQQNLLMLRQFESQPIYRSLEAPAREQFQDLLIEATQAHQMTRMSSQVLDRTSRAFDQILNTNLNDTIRVLTVLSVLIAIPTGVFGFYGINVALPLQDNPWAWLIVIGMSVALAAGVGAFMWRLIRR